MTEGTQAAESAQNNPAVSEAGTGGGNPTSGANNAPAGIPWLNGATQEEVAFAQSKGWDKETTAPADQIFRSYHNMQKLFGADRAGNTVVIPGEGADESALNSFFNRLGRPEAADKYSAGDFDGLSPEQSAELKARGHKLGLTDKQMAGLHEWNKEATAAAQQKLVQDAQIEFSNQEAALKREWGAAYDQNIQLGKEAVAKLGWTQEQIDAMQVGIGYDGVMKLAAQMGKSISEGRFVSNDAGRQSGNPNVLTPEQAKSELKKLQNDSEFQKAWLDKMHPKHEEVIARKSQLSKWAYGA